MMPSTWVVICIYFFPAASGPWPLSSRLPSRLSVLEIFFFDRSFQDEPIHDAARIAHLIQHAPAGSAGWIKAFPAPRRIRRILYCCEVIPASSKILVIPVHEPVIRKNNIDGGLLMLVCGILSGSGLFSSVMYGNH